MTERINKVVLAYSGGLDTSVILRWLIETYDCEVVTFSADIVVDVATRARSLRTFLNGFVQNIGSCC